MFRAPITSTPFVGGYTDAFFPNITGDYYQGDVSFLSTLRALFAPKIQKDDSIRLRFAQSESFKLSQIGDKKEYIKDYIDLGLDKNELVIYNLRGDTEANAQIIDALRDEFPKLHKDYREMKSVFDFYRDIFACVCFSSEKDHTVIYFVSRLNMRSMHYLQASIPVPFTWLMPEITTETFGEDGWALIKSLSKLETKDENGAVVANGADEYLEIIGRMASVYDFEKARIKHLLDGFEERVQKSEISNLQKKVESCDKDIESYEGYIRESLKARNDAIIRIWGLEHKIETLGGESELLDYFLSNKCLYLEDVSGDRIDFCVKTALTYIDPAALEKIMKNPGSFINMGATQSLPADDMNLLLRACLIDGVIKLRMCAAYRLTLRGGVEPLSHHIYPEEFDSYMRNYHIDSAHCMGQYTTPIVSALKSGNFVGAIEQCIASAMSQNVLESGTFNGLIRNIYDNHHPYRKCFELPDGKVVSPEDAVKWLKKQEEASKVEKKTAKKAKTAKEGQSHE